MAIATLSLIVRRCQNLAASLEFYQQLGLCFTAERHGQGPLHYSTSLGGIIFELYPAEATTPPPKSGAPIRIGFTTHSLTETFQAIQRLGVVVRTSPHQTQWGDQAVVLDPDGNVIELLEGESAP